MQASKNHRTLDDRIVFVIPTYNESENIVPLLSQLADLHDGANVRFLVMDDASPDGTAAVAREMAVADSRIRVVDGVREGLGMAYRRGFSYALDTLAAEVWTRISRTTRPIPCGFCDALIKVRTWFWGRAMLPAARSIRVGLVLAECCRVARTRWRDASAACGMWPIARRASRPCAPQRCAALLPGWGMCAVICSSPRC